jgi:hypothetical protein
MLPAAEKSPSVASYVPFWYCTPETSSGIRKLLSEYPWPCACVGMLMGAPATQVARSVPWSMLKPRT